MPDVVWSPQPKQFQSTLPTRGSDRGYGIRQRPAHTISIHAPHEGERRLHEHIQQHDQHFNPRSPRGGATKRLPSPPSEWQDFNPRSPRGGATAGHSAQDVFGHYFNPRSPRGGATDFVDDLLVDGGISIPAPHEGERLIKLRYVEYGVAISIHAPHEGERLSSGDLYHGGRIFQSTLPTRGSDKGDASRYKNNGEFQSTLPTRGSDPRLP